jgi:hypothetical protein
MRSPGLSPAPPRLCGAEPRGELMRAFSPEMGQPSSCDGPCRGADRRLTWADARNAWADGAPTRVDHHRVTYGLE